MVSSPKPMDAFEMVPLTPQSSSLLPSNSAPQTHPPAVRFIFAFMGLQCSYLIWGYMQEKIMTTVFTPTPSSPSGKFPSAAFCVFSNRFLAVILGAILTYNKHGQFFPARSPPLTAFGPCSLSNTCSSWSQYASLNYVSFPMQTLFKSSKIIPVMVMGYFLKGTTYKRRQFLEAFTITFGVFVFSLSSSSKKSADETETIGVLFLVSYILSDAFTSQWQSRIYDKYGKANCDQFQMMLGVNLYAICFTTLGLAMTGDFPVVLEFLRANPECFKYNVITAITSATGQLFIFYTIKEFGPLVFTIIMTTRQMLSIVISTVIFGHAITNTGLLGAAIVFGTIGNKIRLDLQKKKMSR